MIQTKGIADGHRPLSHLDVVRITKDHMGKYFIGVDDLNDRDIHLVIFADDFGRISSAVLHSHRDFFCFSNNMGISQNITIRSDEEARTQSLLLAFKNRALLLAHTMLAIKEIK